MANQQLPLKSTCKLAERESIQPIETDHIEDVNKVTNWPLPARYMNSEMLTNHWNLYVWLRQP